VKCLQERLVVELPRTVVASTLSRTLQDGACGRGCTHQCGEIQYRESCCCREPRLSAQLTIGTIGMRRIAANDLQHSNYGMLQKAMPLLCGVTAFIIVRVLAATRAMVGCQILGLPGQTVPCAELFFRLILAFFIQLDCIVHRLVGFCNNT
jgi:hypothetical protein